MTMPDERMRSLRWGFELLESMAAEPGLPDTLRKQASELLVSYPDPKALEQHVASDAEGLPDAWADAIVGALRLFRKLRAGGWGSKQIRHHLLYTERHYPDEMTVQIMRRCALPRGSIKDWLAPEEQRP